LGAEFAAAPAPINVTVSPGERLHLLVGAVLEGGGNNDLRLSERELWHALVSFCGVG
jgi:hypothetical protein